MSPADRVVVDWRISEYELVDDNVASHVDKPVVMFPRMSLPSNVARLKPNMKRDPKIAACDYQLYFSFSIHPSILSYHFQFMELGTVVGFLAGTTQKD